MRNESMARLSRCARNDRRFVIRTCRANRLTRGESSVFYACQRVFVLFVVLIVAICHGDRLSAQPASGESATHPVTDERIAGADSEPANWLSYGRTYSEQRFSPLDQINVENIDRLKLAWYVDLDSKRGVEATPIVVDGVMYTTAAWSIVYAIDAASGKLLWKYDPKADRKQGFYACCDVVNRGAAVWGDKVYVGVIDGRLIALDAKTGKLVWETVTVDQSKPYTITGAPRVVKGKVIIGNGGAEFGVRGYISAYDAESGKMVWRFYTVPGNPADGFESPEMQKAAATWHGEWWKGGGGGTVWDSMAFDPELDLLYIGTGNGSPWNQRLRSPGGGDNLFLSSIVALRPDTGEYVWHYQTTPGETWDFTSTQHIMLADLNWRGKTRKVLMQAPKNGFFYVIDRETGKLLGADAYVKTTWASHVDLESGRPVETPNARYDIDRQVVQPGPFGGHNWHPMAFSPKTGLVYVPTQELAFLYEDEKQFKRSDSNFNLGINFHAGALPANDADAAKVIKAFSGSLTAWDPVAQAPRWRVHLDDVWNGGALATAGNLVLQGTNRGQLNAYRADTGEKLWSSDVQTGVHAPPISYAVAGRQFIAVSAGSGTALGLAAGQLASHSLAPNRSRMLVFALDGKATLPPAPTVARAAPAHLPAVTADEAALELGKQHFLTHCARCHGENSVSGNVIPDLRYAAALTAPEQWQGIVHDGALVANGMMAFAKWLDPKQTEMVRQYVLSRAKALSRP
ncbi:MAG: PQQ-dependent dehydrogenase, methanol/ethanol family [Gammaproteobacteria bacterium]|nr:PQQ-dependent dehydrogenase, methanol/ethanol family [Gammaproteobacteria bacterium]